MDEVQARMAALETRPRDEPVSQAFLETHCPAVLDGVRRLIRWIDPGPEPAARTSSRVAGGNER